MAQPTDSVWTQLRSEPYLVLGAAAGLGFIVGGGLGGRVLGILGTMAGRMAMATIVEKAMSAQRASLSNDSNSDTGEANP